MGQGYIEVKERKLLATLGALFMLAWPVGTFLLLLIAMVTTNGFVLEALIVLGVVLSVPALMAVAFYRLPRALRLYPEEQVAHRFRALFHVALFNRWDDLSGLQPRLQRTTIVEREAGEQAGGGEALLGCVFALLGPVGLLLSLGLQKKREVRRPASALVCDGMDGPLLLAQDRKTVARVAELYQAIAGVGPSDLTSSNQPMV